MSKSTSSKADKKPAKKADKKADKKAEKKGKKPERKSAKKHDASDSQSVAQLEAGPASDNAEHAAKNGEKLSVEFKSAIAREEAISYFETLVAGLKKGTIRLKQDTKEISLEPPAQLEVKVKGSRKRDKEKLAFEVSWRTSAPNELKISSR